MATGRNRCIAGTEVIAANGSWGSLATDEQLRAMVS
jgi:hypothetical protein